MKRDPQIRCPQCGYRPRAEDRWSCVPSCGTVWHTFWTAGVCPGCRWRWEKTQCPACGALAPHKNWYHQPGDLPAERDSEEQPLSG